MATQQAPRSAGIVVGGIALAAVVVFVITGFVAPGFLLGDDEEPGASAETAGADLLTAIRDRDRDALRAMACPDADESVPDNIDAIENVVIAKELPVRRDGDDAVLPLELEVAGGFNQTYEFVLAQRLTGWCWQDLRPADGADGQEPESTVATPETPDPTTETEVTTEQPEPAPENAADGEQVMTDFVDALNTGTQEVTASLACEAMDVEKDVAALADSEVNLKIASTSSVSNISLNGALTGTIDGKSATGAINALNLDNTWCISTFVVV